MVNLLWWLDLYICVCVWLCVCLNQTYKRRLLLYNKVYKRQKGKFNSWEENCPHWGADGKQHPGPAWVPRAHRACLSPRLLFPSGLLTVWVLLFLTDALNLWKELEFLAIITCCFAYLEYSYAKPGLELFLVCRWVLVSVTYTGSLRNNDFQALNAEL